MTAFFHQVPRELRWAHQEMVVDHMVSREKAADTAEGALIKIEDAEEIAAVEIIIAEETRKPGR